MKAIRVHAPGGPEALRYEEIERPVPGPGQVLVKIEAAGLNAIDVYQRNGHYKVPVPFTLGQEAAGNVAAVGPGVAEPKVGDRVAYITILGTYAEYAVVPADRVVVLPDGVSTKQGAAAMLQGLTAHYLATSTYPLKSGDACLVHAAAGGVGLLLCQVAALRGARVVGTVSTREKAALAREAGADEVILYTREDFEAAVKRLTGGAGLQAIYDSVGQTTFAKGLSCLAPRGMKVLYGQSSGPVGRSEEHTSELQSQSNLVCRLLLEKKKKKNVIDNRTEQINKRAKEMTSSSIAIRSGCRSASSYMTYSHGDTRMGRGDSRESSRIIA